MSNLIENIKSINILRNTAIPAVIVAILALAFYYLTPFVYEGNEYFSMKPLYQTLITLFIFLIAGTLFFISTQGDRLIHFLKETRIELRKVVFPTRSETIKTTGMIMIAVVLVAIFLWIVDAFLSWGVQSISSINIF